MIPDVPRRFAGLPWYDLVEFHSVNDAIWQILRSALVSRGVGDVPLELDRTRAHGVDPEGACLFTQTCGYPIFTTARDHFRILGAPRYSARGCRGSRHRSFILVRSDSPFATPADLRGRRFAINEPDSNSGMNLPRRLFAPLAVDGRFFDRTIVSGSHAASVDLVARGEADAAAIDCVTFALLSRYRPNATAKLRVIAETTTTSTPPLVTSRTTTDAEFDALRASLTELFADSRHAETIAGIGLSGIDFCGYEAYDDVLRYERESAEIGYPILA